MKIGARLTALIAFGASAGMLTLTFAAKPLYTTFCHVTGFGGTTRTATHAPSRVLDRVVRVRFDSNVGADAPLVFKPEQEYIDAKLGQTVMAFFTITNTSKEPVRAIAAYNVAPYKVGVYFNKLECFCFHERTYQPGVTERLPVIFYVAPEMAKDPFATDVKGITLSYTYYRAQDFKPTAQLEQSTSVN
ncbi:MAG: cytochrome c oxidase assembly protein [Alphaproteobacteria bacterium]|nr:cytochrome c oxidase assembly protein [Alphaproteobacteria bacterium]